MNQAQLQTFLAFYRGKGPDCEGRRIEEIWQWDNYLLETTHDYIQWLFPLAETSGFNRRAPVLTAEVIAIFRSSEELRDHLLTSIKVMLAFYGLQVGNEGEGAVEISKSTDYAERKANWIKPSNHNHLRLTRILKSLHTLGLENYAQALFACLERIYQEEPDKIEEESYQYWRDAVYGRS